MVDTRRPPATARRQRGTTVIELTVLVVVFLALVLVTADLSRWLLAINSAYEATNVGARLAAVCGIGAKDAIQRQMQPFMLGLDDSAGELAIVHESGCSTTDEPRCQLVIVALEGYKVQPLSWLLPAKLPLPQIRTRLPVEGLTTSGNPRCS